MYESANDPRTANDPGLRSDLKGLWLLRIPLSILIIKCQKGFSQGKLSCISLFLVRKMPSVYD